MDTEKVIVVLLLVAILLSVVTLTITSSSKIMSKTSSPVVSEDVGTASVVLDIVRNPKKTNLG